MNRHLLFGTCRHVRWWLAAQLRPNAWPSTASRHGVLLGQIKEAHALHREAVAERDRARRLFNRLEAAVTHHRKAHRPGGGLIFEEDADTALWKARDKVLRDYAEGEG